MPSKFILLLSKDGKARRHCHVSWRSGKEIGVLFVPGADTAYAPPQANTAGEDASHLTMLD